jgi:hypothetical protein
MAINNIISQNKHYLSWAITAVLFAASLFLYTRTLHPGVGPYLDSIEYQLTTLTFGVSHPPGYPFYTWMGRLFVVLIPIGNAAYRLSLLSAVSSAVIVALIYHVAYRLTRNIWLGLFGAVSLMVAVRFWYQASYTELYPLYGVFIAASLLSLLAWMETRKPILYFLSAGLYALSFGVNAPAIMLLPMWLWGVLTTDRQMLTKPRNLVLTALIVLVAASQYLYIPLRAFQNPAFCNYCPTDWSRVPAFLSGQEWWDVAYGLAPRYYLQRWADTGYQLTLQFWPLGVLLGGVGLWEMLRRRTQLGVLFLLGISGVWVFVVTNAVVDWPDFLYPLYILYAPLVAVGVAELWEWIKERLNGRPPIWQTVSAAVLIGTFGGLLVATAVNNYPLVDQSERTYQHAWARDLLDQMEPGGWVLTPPTPTDGFAHSWALRFISWSEDRVPDMQIVYLPGLKPPGPPPGYLSWEAAEPHLGKQPLYVIELNDDRLAQFVLLPIERGDGWTIGYRVVGERAANGEVIPWVTPQEWDTLHERFIYP